MKDASKTILIKFDLRDLSVPRDKNILCEYAISTPDHLYEALKRAINELGDEETYNAHLIIQKLEIKN